MAVLFLPNRGFQGYRLLGNFQNLAYLVEGNLHLDGNLLWGWFAPDLLDKVARSTDQLVNGLNHMDGDTNSPGLIGNGTRDRLANPPCGVSGKLIAPLILKLVHRLHKTDVSLLDQIQKLEPAVGIFFRNADDQAKIGFNQLFLSAGRTDFSFDNGGNPPFDLFRRHLEFPLHPSVLSPRTADSFPHLFNRLLTHPKASCSPLPILLVPIPSRNKLEDLIGRPPCLLFKLAHPVFQLLQLIQCHLELVPDDIDLNAIKLKAFESL